MRRTIFDVMDELFANDFKPAMVDSRRHSTPMCNVIESETDYTIQLAAPGFAKEDVQVKLDEEDALVISLQKKEDDTESPERSEHNEVAKVETKRLRYLRREFAYQGFVQRLLLPEDSDKDGVTAVMENGVLEVVIPKLKEEKKTIERMISVQ